MVHLLHDQITAHPIFHPNCSLQKGWAVRRMVANVQDTSPNVMFVCTNNIMSLITQNTRESRVPRLNVHTNQILPHTFSHGTLDSVAF